MWKSLAKKSIWFFALLASSVTSAQDTINSGDVSALTDSQLAAKSLLLDMAAYLADTPRFQVDMRVGYDSVVENGQKIEHEEQRQLSVERPTFVLDEVKKRVGFGELVLFDGKWITVSDPKTKVYTRAPQPGDIDATARYFVDELGMRLPLSLMLMNQFPQELQKCVVEVDYVGEAEILGQATTHLAGRTQSIDFQIWIDSGHEPLPLRVVLAYREEPGEPRYWVDFSNWNLNPSFLRGAFKFVPPAKFELQSLEPKVQPITEDDSETSSRVTSP